MHFPEEQLTTYLRVFMPEDRIDDVLDQIAQAAIECAVDDEMELYALAHWLMDADDRRTHDVEAAVLVEEVGLAPAEVAFILDLEVADVEAAVATGWAELDQPMPEPGEPEPEPEPAAFEPAMAAPPVTTAPAARRTPRRAMPLVVGGIVVGGLVVLAVAMFSAAGQARLNAAGLDPVVTFLVVVLLIGGGTALVRAGAAPPRPADPSDEPAAPSS